MFQSPLDRFRRAVLLALVFALAGQAPAVLAQRGYSRDMQRSSPAIIKAFREVVAQPSESTVRILCDGKPAALGAVVDENGWIITKASLLTGAVVCKFKDGRELPAVIVGADEPYDLALVKVAAKDLVPVEWRNSKELVQGMWLASVGIGENPVAIGVVGVVTRNFRLGDQPPKIRSSKSGYLGVMLDGTEKGAKIKAITRDGPADKSGLKVDDIVIEAGKKKVVDVESFINIVQGHSPGDELALKVLRGAKTLELTARLGKLPKDFAGNPQDSFGSILSDRRGGFPAILQHDTVILPSDCGGPVVDLDGKTVGINIARAGRTETYAIPSENVRALIDELKKGKGKQVQLPPRKADDVPVRDVSRPVNEAIIVLRATGTLSDADPLDRLRTESYHKVHTVKLQAGMEYTIDLKSHEFDSFLRLEDAKGRNLKQDDDSGGDLNARIVFRAPSDGDYRIIVTSFESGETGEYTLVVRQTAGKK